MDYLFGHSDMVGTKDHPLTMLDQVHRCTAAMAIQSFKGCHSKTFLINVVVRELNQWHTLVPLVRVVQYTSSEHIFKNLVYPLYLIVSLWMISRAVDQTRPHGSMQLLPEASNKLGPSVRSDIIRDAM
jgi:hypothetical protein